MKTTRGRTVCCSVCKKEIPAEVVDIMEELGGIPPEEDIFCGECWIEADPEIDSELH